MDDTTLLKYLRFLREESSRLLAKDRVERYEVDSLRRELDRLKVKCGDCSDLDPTLLLAVFDLQLDIDERLLGGVRWNLLASILKIIAIGSLLHMVFDSESTKEIRLGLSVFRDRLDGLLFIQNLPAEMSER